MAFHWNELGLKRSLDKGRRQLLPFPVIIIFSKGRGWNQVGLLAVWEGSWKREGVRRTEVEDRQSLEEGDGERKTDIYVI